MAEGGNIGQRITDLIGSQYSTDAAYEGDLINAAFNEIVDMTKEDLLIKYSADPINITSTSSGNYSNGTSVEDKKVLKVTRVDADSNGIERECKFLDRTEFEAAKDTSSIYYATVNSPVYTLNSDNTTTELLVFPHCSAAQNAKVWVKEYAVNGTSLAGITYTTLGNTHYMPPNIIHALVLKSCINILNAYISNQIQDEEDIELMQMIQQQIQGLEKNFNVEMQRFMEDGSIPTGSE
tara:strand:+ start:677 stop:1387 length:711 start_codon:yes stop_codon:yes gene_type:complete